nr:RNA polymerase subunit sigma-70 [Aureimonas jatrophae]
MRQSGNEAALEVLGELRKRDKAKRSLSPARRVTGRKMTPELARRILELHGATRMTQQEIAFKLGVNQGRVNEVVKRGKWLTDDPAAPEQVSRDKAMERMAKPRPTRRKASVVPAMPRPRADGQLSLLGDF